jgi:Carboxypeptidase regulatory-like domain
VVRSLGNLQAWGLALLAWLAICGSALAQGGATLTGQVMQSDGQPLPFAAIRLIAERDASLATAGAAADESGRFTLVVPALPARLAISAVGFQTDTLIVSDPAAPISVSLVSSEGLMKGVEISGARPLQPEQTIITAQEVKDLPSRAKPTCCGPYS